MPNSAPGGGLCHSGCARPRTKNLGKLHFPPFASPDGLRHPTTNGGTTSLLRLLCARWDTSCSYCIAYTRGSP